MNEKRSCSVPSSSASCASGVSAPGPHTSMHSRQPVHFHGSMVAANSPPVPGTSFSAASKNGRVRATGNTRSASTSASRLRRSVGLSVSVPATTEATTSANSRSDFSLR